MDSFHWYRTDCSKRLRYYLYSILSLGIVPCFVLFYPTFEIELGCLECPPVEAEFIVQIQEENKYCSQVGHHHFGSEHLLTLELNFKRFAASSLDNYTIRQVPDSPPNFGKFFHPNIHENSAIVLQREILKALYGPNRMNIEEEHIFYIIAKHSLNPFVLFGYFAAMIWYICNYYYFASLTLLICLSGVWLLTENTLINNEKLKTLIGKSNTVTLVPGGLATPVTHTHTHTHPAAPPVLIEEKDLVPGDLVFLSKGSMLNCDLILVKGRVVIDESMITGESMPITKLPVDLRSLKGASVPLTFGITCLDNRDLEDFTTTSGASVLSSGSVPLFVSDGAVGVCYRTSFRSVKGQLVSTLLRPRDAMPTIWMDAVWVVFILFLLTTLFYFYEGYVFSTMGMSSGLIVLYYFYALSIAIPIALVACLLISTLISVNTLKTKDISVSESSSVNLAGMVNVLCFDKTGTLTEDTLQLQGLLIHQNSIPFEHSVQKKNVGEGEWAMFPSGSPDLPFICSLLLATCHGLSLFSSISNDGSTPQQVIEKESPRGDLEDGNQINIPIGSPQTPPLPVGDPLELELLMKSGWTLQPLSAQQQLLTVLSPPPLVSPYEILKHFTFTAERLRAASLVAPQHPDPSENPFTPTTYYLVKGSPEIILSLCSSESIPPLVQIQLDKATRKGLRVLGMAYRPCPEPSSSLLAMSQDDIESSAPLLFLGLIILSSCLKPDSFPVIKELHSANIHVAMITGDHIHTAISVGVDCGILQPLSPISHSSSSQELDEWLGRGPSLGSQTVIIDENQNFDSYIIRDASSDLLLPLSAEQLLLAISANQHKNTPSSSSFSFASSTSPIQVAMTGRGMQQLRKACDPIVFHCLVRETLIFARTKPIDKRDVVTELLLPPLWNRIRDIDGQSRYEIPVRKGIRSNNSAPQSIYMNLTDPSTFLQPDSVMFCGDGANDMLALRASTVGLSLCDAETSIAAPITSKKQTPGSVLVVLLQGRSSLITTYVLFHFNIHYAWIVLLQTLIAWSYGLEISDSMYFVQLFLTLVPGTAIAFTPPTEDLCKERPSNRYFTLTLQAQLLPHLAIFTIFQFLALYLLSIQSFYVRFSTDDPFHFSYSYETTVLEQIVLVQILIASVVSTIGDPFRLPWYTNYWHVVSLVLGVGWIGYETFAGASSFAEDTLGLVPLPTYFGWYLVGLDLAHLLLSMVVWGITDSFCRSSQFPRVLPPMYVEESSRSQEPNETTQLLKK